MTTTPGSSTPKNLLLLAAAAVGVGALAGLVTALFRLALQHADQWRGAFLVWAQGQALLGLVLSVAGVAGLTAVAAWLVRRFFPHAGGSGIPHVEAVVNDELPPAPLRLLPIKFIGGWLAIGGGLALGREGPSVQMGACLGSEIGRRLRVEKSDLVALLAAGAGAGLATAFNAPIAGAVFVLEELVRRFDTRTAIAALGASAGAIGISRLFLGDGADFKVGLLPYPSNGNSFLFLAVGVLAGFFGIAYNRLLLGTLAISDRWAHQPIELRAALIGGCVGALAWFAPHLVGGGDALTQNALNATATGSVALLMVFVLRFLLGAASYAAGTPGGLFAPMLVLGAQLGLLFAWLCQSALPGFNVSPTAFAVVGMAAFFTAVVRAPVTGIILTVELTGQFTQLLPMLWACFAAMAVPTLFGSKPIYVSLKERTLRLHA